jgi:hypothetical protein
MPSRIYKLAQKIIGVPRFIANCIARFGSYMVSKCENIINYINHKINEFPNDAIINRNVSIVNLADDNLAIDIEDIHNQLVKTQQKLDSRYIEAAVSLIFGRGNIKYNHNNIQYLNTIYLYITQLWANVAGQERFSIRLSLADTLKGIEPNATNKKANITYDKYISLINMMLNLYYIKQDSKDIKKCADFILKIQNFAYDAGNIEPLTQAIEESQESMYSINSYDKQKKLKNYLMLFFKLVEVSLQHNIENDIMYNTVEDLQYDVNKIYMFEYITEYANKLYMSSSNKSGILSVVECYLMVYSYLATDQDITANLKLPQISQECKHFFQQAKKVLTKDADLTRILSRRNLLKLARRQEIDKHLYNELPRNSEIYESKDVECCLTYKSPSDTEQHNFVKYEGHFYTYDTFRRLYIQQGKDPYTRSKIDLNKLQRIIYMLST